MTENGTESRHRTVLCIEDDPDMIKLIELSLRRGPFRVMGALSGEEGLNLARRMRPDVVLLDLMMPGMDGIEVHRRLKADEALREVPVIIVTGKRLTKREAEGLNANDVIAKPFVPKDLMRRVTVAAGAVP